MYITNMKYYTPRNILARFVLIFITVFLTIDTSIETNNWLLAADRCQRDAQGRYQVPTDDCCTLPTGGVLSDCPNGTVPKIGGFLNLNPDNCSCVEVNYKVQQFFNILNGIIIPVTILIGIVSIMINGYKILTSQGNPQELQAGKEGVTSAIIGLLFSLMAVSILRVIIKSTITGDVDPFG